ncbi:MAG: pseudouridine synthase [bacterium]|nr:RNA pseudouridine synthase [Gammaproteobacteria bacterium]
MDKYTFHIPAECHEPVTVIHADEHILVVNKPSGLLSVPGRIVKDCVIQRMRCDYPQVAIVHRLDLDTSGLQLMSLSKLATSDLNRQFRERQVYKEYVAEVFGLMDDDVGEINAAIAPDPLNRPRQLVDHDRGKAALTRFEVLDRSTDHSNLVVNSTRVRLKPVTGRSHQLRVHMASIGHPILGCDLYAHEQARNAASRLYLHATFLRITHPGTGKEVEFESPVPF